MLVNSSRLLTNKISQRPLLRGMANSRKISWGGLHVGKPKEDDFARGTQNIVTELTNNSHL